MSLKSVDYLDDPVIVCSLKEAESSSDPLSRLSTSEIKAMLIESYRNSDYASTVRKRIRETGKMVSILLWFKIVVHIEK